MFGLPQKNNPVRTLNIVYPEKHTQDFISIQINVSKPTITKSNGCRRKFEACIKLSTRSRTPSPHAIPCPQKSRTSQNHGQRAMSLFFFSFCTPATSSQQMYSTTLFQIKLTKGKNHINGGVLLPIGNAIGQRLTISTQGVFSFP